MVGTPAKRVTRSRVTIAAASSGVKRGSRVKLPPTARVAFWMQVWPKEWNSGSVARATSSAFTGIRRGTTMVQLTRRFAWLSSAPFGLPVVPEV